MKKIYFLICVSLLTVNGIAQKQLVVDAHAEKRSLNGRFDSIIVSGGINLYLSQSDQEEVAISASEEKFRVGIKTIVENNTLKIFYDGDKGWNRKDREMRVYVSFNDLGKLEGSGASDIIVAGDIKVRSLLMKLSGASNFKGSISVSTLKLDLSGASDILLSGMASTVNIESSGASDVKAYDLVADICHANVSGASDVNITVNKELHAHASGASEIYFKGAAEIKNMVSSGSSVIKRKN